MRTLTRRILGVAAPATLAVGMLMAGPAQAATPADSQASGATHGCPYGAVCVYPNASWNGDNPSHVFWSYGSHNLSNQYGQKRLFNNQSGGAKAHACRGYNGTDCWGNQKAYTYADYDFTPINSIKIAR